MDKKYNIIVFTMIGGLILISNIACTKVSREERVAPPATEQFSSLSKVGLVCAIAKGFALGAKAASDVQTAYKGLSSSDLTELSDKKACSPDFAVLMSTGLASPESYEILNEYIASLPAKDAPKNKLIARSVVKELRSSKRSSDEKPADRQKMLELVLSNFPERINDIKKSDGKFDSLAFNNLVSSLDASKVGPIAAALEKGNLDTWFEWATDIANKAQGQPAFKNLYNKVAASEQELLRSKLLEKNLSEKDHTTRLNNMRTFLNEADAWGIKAGLDTDQYKLSSSPGNTFAGSLLYVLMMRAIRDDHAPGAVSKQSYDDLHEYAEAIKREINDNAKYLAHATVTKWGNPKVKIRKALSKELAPAHYENFVDYYLVLDTPRDVFAAVQRPVNEVTNEDLRKLYEKVIGIDNVKATTLSNQAAATPPHKRFIDFLVGRAVDASGYSNKILDNFLNTINVVAVPGQLDGGAPALIPFINLLNAAGGDAVEKEKMLQRLSAGDDGSILNKLTGAALKNLVSIAYKNSGPGGKGQAEFKAMYTKPMLTAAKKQVMRSELLQKAYDKSSGDLQTLVDEIASNADKWGLRADLLADSPFDLANYQAGQPAHSGPLLYVLTKRNIQEPGKEKDLRGYAQAIKNALAGAYANHISVTPYNGEIIANVLRNHLTTINKQDFTNSYLGIEDIQDVFNAAAQAENLVSNATLRELYNTIIGDQRPATQTLATKPPGAGNRFLHNLLKRSADIEGNSKEILIKFLNNLFVLGIPNEQNILAQVKNGKTPLKLFMEANRPLAPSASDDAAQREAMLSRLLLNANVNMFASLTPADLGAQVQYLSMDPALFKRIYTLLNGQLDANSKNQAKAMRSALLAMELKKGAKSFKAFLAELIDPLDKWGLRAGLNADIYALDKLPLVLGVPHEGSLLYVLTKRAIDLGGNSHYDTLKTYAALLKPYLPQFNNHISATPWGPLNETIKQALVAALGGAQDFANFYLANEGIADIYDAAGTPEINVPNAMLKRLYMAIVGDDVTKAAQLALAGGAGNNRFIHRLLGRSADNDTAFLLRKFLKSVYKNAENITVGNPAAKQLAAKTAELDQLNDPNGGSYPLQVLLTRINAADDKKAKAEIVDRLLKNDDGVTVWPTITAPNLMAQKWFYSGGAKGKSDFIAMYNIANIAGDPAKRLAMRSALIADAAERGPNEIKTLIKDITNIGGDTWGLQASLATDEYELPARGMGILPYRGTLLYVLSKNAAEELKLLLGQSQNKSFPILYKTLNALREVAGDIKTLLEGIALNSYIPYVNLQNPPHSGITAASELSDAFTVLFGPVATATFPHLFAGYKEYFLLLDNTFAGFDEDLIFNAIQNPSYSGFGMAEFKWLYDQVIKTDANAATLAAKEKDDAGVKHRFIHFLAMRDIASAEVNKPGLYEVLQDFLQKVYGDAVSNSLGATQADKDHDGDLAVQQEIARLGTAANKNALQLLADVKRLKESGATIRAKMMAMLASKANTATLGTLTKNELVNVLNSARDQLPAKLKDIATKLHATQWADFAGWCVTPFMKAKVYADNLDEPAVEAACKNQFGVPYTAAPIAIQEAMRNAIVKEAYRVGFANDGVLGGLNSVAKLIGKSVLSDVVVKAFDFAPFGGANSSLLYAVIEEAKPKNKADVDQIIAALRPLFANLPLWQAYLDDVTNPGGESVVKQIERYILIASPALLPLQITTDAETWLSYNI